MLSFCAASAGVKNGSGPARDIALEPSHGQCNMKGSAGFELRCEPLEHVLTLRMCTLTLKGLAKLHSWLVPTSYEYIANTKLFFGFFELEVKFSPPIHCWLVPTRSVICKGYECYLHRLQGKYNVRLFFPCNTLLVGTNQECNVWYTEMKATDPKTVLGHLTPPK